MIINFANSDITSLLNPDYTVSTISNSIAPVFYCPLLFFFWWRSGYLLNHSQIQQSLGSSYMSTQECSSTFLTLLEKFLSFSALFATNAVSRTSVQLHQLLTSRESLMLSREALNCGKHKPLRTY